MPLTKQKADVVTIVVKDKQKKLPGTTGLVSVLKPLQPAPVIAAVNAKDKMRTVILATSPRKQLSGRLRQMCHWTP